MAKKGAAVWFELFMRFTNGERIHPSEYRQAERITRSAAAYRFNTVSIFMPIVKDTTGRYGLVSVIPEDEIDFED